MKKKFLSTGVVATVAAVLLASAPPSRASAVRRTLIVQEVAPIAPARARVTICREEEAEPPTCLTITLRPRAGKALSEALRAWADEGLMPPGGEVFRYTN